MKILVVDDDPQCQELLVELAASEERTVISTQSGESAWKIIGEDPEVRLVLLDWVLPDVDGVELCRRLRGTELGRYVYVIMVSGKTDRQDIIAGLSAGADDFVCKPVDKEELAARLAIGERIVRLECGLVDAREHMERLANLDALTGLANRRALAERVEAEISAARRNNTPLSVILLDIDEFKQVNDQFGHLVGDVVLREVAECLAGGLRSSDYAGRYGGDEFVLILPHCNYRDALSTAERLCQRLADHDWSGRLESGQQVTASFGLAVLRSNDPHETADSLMRRADRALYRAKHGGRNRVRLER